ncbi:MAG: substrate-binding domain-containing protein, partial [Lentisphaeria bacterium]|nr:substrate-binding domain-containing protein [Lentisphaeria bacterium]
EWICNIGWFPDTIQPAVRALLAGEDRPEALIVNDAQSGSVYAAIRQMKLGIGTDVSVGGCDDLEYVKYFEPPLATVAIDRQQIAAHLCRLIEQPDFSRAEFIRLEFKNRPSIRQNELVFAGQH